VVQAPRCTTGGLGIRRWCIVARDLHREGALSGLSLREDFSQKAGVFGITEANRNG
jgi:hypothetical protein